MITSDHAVEFNRTAWSEGVVVVVTLLVKDEGICL